MSTADILPIVLAVVPIVLPRILDAYLSHRASTAPSSTPAPSSKASPPRKATARKRPQRLHRHLAAIEALAAKVCP